LLRNTEIHSILLYVSEFRVQYEYFNFDRNVSCLANIKYSFQPFHENQYLVDLGLLAFDSNNVLLLYHYHLQQRPGIELVTASIIDLHLFECYGHRFRNCQFDIHQSQIFLLQKASAYETAKKESIYQLYNR